MIDSLRGTVAAIGTRWVVLDVNGVGFKVWCTPNTAASMRMGEQTFLEISMQVREDAITLYGFAGQSEKLSFEMLRQVNGIGPKKALEFVSVISPADFVQAVTENKPAVLAAAKGVGLKSAQSIILALGDKIGLLAHAVASESGTPTTPTHAWKEQVSNGLEGLGWKPKEISSAIDTIAPLVDDDPEISLGALMKAALQSLNTTRR